MAAEKKIYIVDNKRITKGEFTATCLKELKRKGMYMIWWLVYVNYQFCYRHVLEYLIISVKSWLFDKTKRVSIVNDDTGRKIKNINDFAHLKDGSYLMYLFTNEKWSPPFKTKMTKLVEKIDNMKSLYRHRELDENELLLLAKSIGKDDEILQHVRCV